MSTRTKTRPKRSRSGNRAVLSTVTGWLNAAEVASALAYVVHIAEPSAVAVIAEKSLGITESVAATYGVTDDAALEFISDQVTAALAVDLQEGEYSESGETALVGAALDRTLQRLNRDLSRRAGTR